MRACVALLLLPLLLGCAGGSANDPSPFAGTYEGPWVKPGHSSSLPNEWEGTANLQVFANGSVRGSFEETVPSLRAGALRGTLKDDGTFDFVVHFPDGIVRYGGDLRLQDGLLMGPFSERGVGYVGFSPTFALRRR